MNGILPPAMTSSPPTTSPSSSSLRAAPGYGLLSPRPSLTDAEREVRKPPGGGGRVLERVCEMVRPGRERDGPIEAGIIDATGFPKKGKHSVGVGRQYCGQLGKQDNCQAAVSLSIANRGASLPVRYRLYLPQEWAGDAARRDKAHVPEEIVFKTKPEIALEQLRWACAARLPRGVVLLAAA